jgi:UDP-glucose 4-epimerase
LRKQLLWDACRKLTSHDAIFKGSGTEIRDWLHVDDATELLLAGAKNASPQCPIVNGGTGEGVSVRAIVTRCAENLLLKNTDVYFSGTASPGDPFQYIADTARAREWGWAPERHWNEGVAEYCAWWLETEALTQSGVPAQKCFS